ncbi:MAG: hypothetical protein ABJB47_07440 [Actinomycetota bacterium]
MTPGGSAQRGYGTPPPRPAPRHLAAALACGLGAALAGAAGWALVAYYARRDVTALALLAGPLVGVTVARQRRRDRAAAAGSAVLAVAACAAGSFLAVPFALAGAGVTVSSIVGHLGLIARAYPSGIGLRTAGFWAAAAVLGFWIPLRWAAARRTPSWRR